MYCQHCGKEIPNNSPFCNHCGTEQIVLSQPKSPQSKYSNINNSPNQVQPSPPYYSQQNNIPQQPLSPQYSKQNSKTKGAKKVLKVISRIWAIIAVVVVLLFIASIISAIYHNPNIIVAGIVLVLIIIAFLSDGDDFWFWW